MSAVLLQPNPARTLTVRAPSVPCWSRPRAFIIAAAGVAIGLGNVWRLPSLVYQHGGGAFLLAYVAALVLLGLPMLMAEIMVGRLGRSNPAACYGKVARDEGRNWKWQLAGIVGPVAGWAILAVCSLVAAWSGVLLLRVARSQWTGIGFLSSSDFSQSRGALVAGQLLFLAAVAVVTRGGIRARLESLQAWTFTVLLLLIGGLAIYAAISTDHLGETMRLVLKPDFARLGWIGLLEASRLAVLTLGLGLGAMISVGAALPPCGSIARGAIMIVVLDTIVALLAVLMVCAVLRGAGRLPVEGAELAFAEVPAALSRLPGGAEAAIAFFAFLLLAAFAGGIGIFHPQVELVVEWTGGARGKAAFLVGGAAWVVGAATIFLFQRWAALEWLGMIASNLLLPAAALGGVVFAGWAMSRRASRSELALRPAAAFILWRGLIRYPAPALLGAMLVAGAVDLFLR